MSSAELDHLVVAAHTLDAGIAHVTQALGIEPAPGGRHPDMGTHNALLRLGPATYLEVIAIDPEAASPGARRWFDLDGSATGELLDQGPRLLTWVARSDDLEGLVARCEHDPGPVRRMRRGELTWRIAFPEDGALVEDGLVPPLIEWDPGMPHPAASLPDAGCQLLELQAFHPQADRVRGLLEAIGLDGALALEPTPPGGDAFLQAWIRTPDGPRVLA